MENAIKKAIEGGYEVPFHTEKDVVAMVCVLDPLFWQALEKAEGWVKIEMQMWEKQKDGRIGYVIKPRDGWIFYWHRFIDHIASGKDIGSFFEELLNK